ncbi:MAG: FHA domain-containing protein [Gemmataceae bacterium]
MSREVLGELIPVGGGDPIPLAQPHVTIGRRGSCDICLNFQNVSGTHCELVYDKGFWSVRDLNSSNKTRVNGEKILPMKMIPVKPGDEVRVATHAYTIQYVPADGAHLAMMEAEEEDIFSQSLMEKAGLAKPKGSPRTDRY